MSIRALKLNLRTTLCFGVVCLLLLIQGAMTLIKVDKVYSSTVDIETNWLPSIRLGGEIDAAFYKLRLDLRRFVMEIPRHDPASIEKLKSVRADALEIAERYAPLGMLRSTCCAAAASRNLHGTQRYLLKTT